MVVVSIPTILNALVVMWTIFMLVFWGWWSDYCIGCSFSICIGIYPVGWEYSWRNIMEEFGLGIYMGAMTRFILACVVCWSMVEMGYWLSLYAWHAIPLYLFHFQYQFKWPHVGWNLLTRGILVHMVKPLEMSICLLVFYIWMGGTASPIHSFLGLPAIFEYILWWSYISCSMHWK